MKKLLTIMVLALALCLVCGAALASDTQNFDYTVVTTDLGTGIPTVIKVEGNNYNLINTDVLAKAQCGNEVNLTYQFGTDLRVLTLPIKHNVPLPGEAGWVHNADNTITFTCKWTKCGASVTIATPADSAAGTYHTYIEKVTKEPTCQDTGIKQTVCSKCGAVKPGTNSEIVGTAKHSPIYIVVNYPTCDNAATLNSGIVYLGCKYCEVGLNVVGGEAIALQNPAYIYCTWSNGEDDAAPKFNYYYKTATYAPKTSKYDPHAWGNWSLWSAATCALNSTYDRSCPVCHASQKKDNLAINGANDNLGSKYALISTVKPVEKNCWKVQLTFRCSRCNGATCGDVIVTLEKGKADKFAFAGSGNYYKAKNTAAIALSGLTDAQVGALIGFDRTAILNTVFTHTYELTDAWLIGEVKASCKTMGYKLYACKYCNDGWHAKSSIAGYKLAFAAGDITAANAYSDYQLHVVKTADKLPHDYTGYTCTKAPDEANGVYGRWTRTCKVCGETDEYVWYWPPFDMCDPHTPVLDEEASIAPTCEDVGYNFYYCSTCHYWLDDLTEEVPALDHDWDETVKKAATCTEEGLVNRVCTRCGIGETDVPTPKAAHQLDAGVVTKEATLTEKGEITYTCTVCKVYTEVKEFDYVPTEPAVYTLTASYDGTTVKGKLVHDPATVEAATTNIRVTFYVEGNYYMATMAEVDAEGNFTVDGVGPIKYITVAATGNTSVNPEDYVAIAEPTEIFVK